MDILDKVIAYECGEMEEDEYIPFMQELIDTGLAWQLQGSYGRAATMLIRDGHCHPPDNAQKHG